MRRNFPPGVGSLPDALRLLFVLELYLLRVHIRVVSRAISYAMQLTKSPLCKFVLDLPSLSRVLDL
jgi:hypothetical protein